MLLEVPIIKDQIVDYVDENGHVQKVMLPEGVPVSEAHKGIPLALGLGELYPDSFAEKLQEALWKRGMATQEDFQKPGAINEVRRAIQQIVKADANKTVDFILGRGMYHD